MTTSVTAIKSNPTDARLALLPLLPPLVFLMMLLDNPFETVKRWIGYFLSLETRSSDVPSVGSQLLAYLTMAILGFFATSNMVPTIKEYTLRKGISGKDLGKKGTAIEDIEV